jgi:hypothetical protein
MRHRVTNWIVTAVRRRRAAPAPVAPDAPPTGPPPDHERILQVGDVLQGCYPESEVLDDNFTALMLHLTVEPPPPAPRKR